MAGVRKSYPTHYGTIRYIEGVCKDDFSNIVLYHQTDARVVKLQRPAMESFRESERKLAEILHKPVYHVPLTGTGWRSCSFQRELWLSNPLRFANPVGSLHPAGIAIDLDTTNPHFAKCSDVLLGHGWHLPRADEPWHHSFRLNG